MASPFLKLPAELRLHIYGHFYCPPQTENANLLHTDPPTKALLSTSKQIHHETRHLYKSSYRAYWTLSAFTLDEAAIPHTPAARTALLALRQEDLNHIATLTIYGKPSAHYISRTSILVDNRGGWREVITAVPRGSNNNTLLPPSSGATEEAEEDREKTPTTTTYYRRYRVWLTRIEAGAPSKVHPTRLAWDGHGDEISLKRACEACCSTRSGGKMGVRHQILNLLGWEI